MKLCENWWKGNIIAIWPEVAKLKYRIDSILLTPMKQFNFVKMLSLLDNKCTKCNCKTFIIFNAFLSCNMTKKKEEKKKIFHKNFLYFQDIAYVTCCSLQLRNIWYLFSIISILWNQFISLLQTLNQGKWGNKHTRNCNFVFYVFRLVLWTT